MIDEFVRTIRFTGKRLDDRAEFENYSAGTHFGKVISRQSASACAINFNGFKVSNQMTDFE
jgi:hypothetical protein